MTWEDLVLARLLTLLGHAVPVVLVVLMGLMVWKTGILEMRRTRGDG